MNKLQLQGLNSSNVTIVFILALLAACAPEPEAQEATTVTTPVIEQPGQPAHPDFTGVWSGYLTTVDHPWWKLTDISCFAGCPAAIRNYMEALLADPANSSREQSEVGAELSAFVTEYETGLMTAEGLDRLRAGQAAAADFATFCEPYAVVREAMNPLPFRIHDQGDHLLFEYEEWSLNRTIHMDGAAPPAATTPSPLGYSSGRYEGDTLVIETSALTGDYYPGRTAGSYSDAATIVERYVIEEEPRRLVLELTVTDPQTLLQPYPWSKNWLNTPEVELLKDSCEDVPGEF